MIRDLVLLLAAGVFAALAGCIAVPPPVVEAPAVAVRSDQRAFGKDTGLQMKLVSFNIRFGTADDGDDSWPNRRDMVIDLLQASDADVIGLQEALRFQLDQIGAAMPGYVEIGVAREDGFTVGEYVPLLVRTDRFAIAESGSFWLSETPEVPGSAHWGNAVPRVCTWARLIEKPGSRTAGPDGDTRDATPAGGGVWVYNVHLDHISQWARARGAERVVEHIGARPIHLENEPVVLMGDFNASESNDVVEYLKGLEKRASSDEEYTPPPSPELVDTFRAVHPNETEVGTASGFRYGATNGSKIDHVLVSPGAKVLDAGIDRTSRDRRYPSDHFPVWAVVRF